MGKIGLFYGSDTGCTEVIVERIKELLGEEQLVVHDMSSVKDIDLFSSYKKILIGVPTWYDGDLQSDWDDFFEKFQTINFEGKTVAIFGLGDQIGYAEYFVDGIGTLGHVILENGGNLIGPWTTEGYEFDASKAVFEADGQTYFMGLALDEDNQSEMTDDRLFAWLQEISEELGVALQDQVFLKGKE